MAITQSHIDTLNAAIASGERVVVLNGQSITYRTVADLIQARNDLLKQMQDAEARAAGRVRPKRFMAYYSGRGY